MSTKLRVLSIDDNHQNLSILQQALESQFDVVSSPGEESIEELILDCEPDIILLDIMLTDTDGYAVCRQIRAMTLSKKVVVIFISSLQSLEDKIKAYEAGGDDYICKPVNIEELIFKLTAYEKLINEQHCLEQKMEEASQAAFASMQQSSELGLLFEFFSTALNILDFETLFHAIRNIIAKFHLSCAMEFRTQNSTAQFPPEHLSQLESEILELGKRAKRVVPFGKNALFNSKYCSLLIKNLPQDEDSLGRLSDHLVIFLDIISNQVKAIESEENRQQRQDQTVSQIKTGLHLSLTQVNQAQQRLTQSNQQVFNQLTEQLKQKLTQLGVNQQHQSEVNQLLDQSQQQLEQTIKNTLDVNNQNQHLEQLLSQIK